MQPNEMTDEQAFGAPPMHMGEMNDAQAFGMPAPPPPKTMLDNIEHYAGLGAGTLVKGIGAAADIGPGLVNMAHTLYTNDPKPIYPMPFSQAANAYVQNTQPPQTPGEQEFQDIGAGAVAGSMGGPTAMAGGAAATGAGQWVGNRGGTPREQMLAAMLAGTATTAGIGAARMAIGPSTTAGKNALMAQYLLKNTQKPDAAIDALGTDIPAKNWWSKGTVKSNIPEYVPNSPVTAGPASQDYGLLGLERGLRNIQGSNFGEIGESQNAARQAALNEIAGTPQELAGEIQNRDMTTGQMREAAFAGKNNVLPSEPLDAIDEIAKSPVGKRDAVSSAMEWARGKLIGVKDPEDLYAVRQDINDAMQGKFNQDKPALALAKSQLKQVKEALDTTIERGAPGYKDYLSKYVEMSKPINQMETLQDLQDRIGNTSKDPVTGMRQLSQAKLDRNIVNNEDLANLTPEQHGVLGNIEADMNRSNAVNSPLVRPSGSDTAANNLLVAGLSKLAHKGSFGLLEDSNVDPLKLSRILQDPAATRAMLIKAQAEPGFMNRIGRNYAAMLMAQNVNQGAK